MIDVLRNSVAFSSADQIVTAFEIIQKHDALQLVRYKNKYHVDSLWQDKPPPFRNLMVNVLFTHKGFSIVGELQLTTIASVKIKKIQHKVYELLRAWEGGRGNQQAYRVILSSVCKPE